jgi:hypothetical protein
LSGEMVEDREFGAVAGSDVPGEGMGS